MHLCQDHKANMQLKTKEEEEEEEEELFKAVRMEYLEGVNKWMNDDIGADRSGDEDNTRNKPVFWGENIPAVHVATHDDAITAENNPVGQFVHCNDPLSENVPAIHA